MSDPVERTVLEEVRRLVGLHGRLPCAVERVGDDENLFALGLASFAAVQLLIAIEESFEIEFDTIDVGTFATCESISRGVSSLIIARQSTHSSV